MRNRTVGINIRVTVTEKKKGDEVCSEVWLVTFGIFTPAGAGI